ncbi:hypothetical protein HYC85_008574 [Camellia sinensis]|uniref:Uncharacterized protein n=1 Tax=Camellia sinensis TaxID=4442 RepID=A0A7J7HUS2_CAMSI|nr:hypothetical protein HYC85_008574 [Camellia sinensis]
MLKDRTTREAEHEYIKRGRPGEKKKKIYAGKSYFTNWRKQSSKKKKMGQNQVKIKKGKTKMEIDKGPTTEKTFPK